MYKNNSGTITIKVLLTLFSICFLSQLDAQVMNKENSNPKTISTQLDSFLQKGLIKEGLKNFTKPSSNSELFSLALLQTLDALQQFSKGMNSFQYTDTFYSNLGNFPFFRVVMRQPNSLKSEPATPEKFASLFKDFKIALQKANKTILQIDKKEFKVQVNLSQLSIDFDGDGIVSPNEKLVNVLGTVINLSHQNNSKSDIIVRFDNADAIWLEGYKHLVSALLEIVLSYDWSPLWDQCAHIIFANPKPEPPIAQVSVPVKGFGNVLWVDLIATLHSLHLKPVDKTNLLSGARDEFRAMVNCSRLSWKRIQEETDNDLEWIPSTKQTGPDSSLISQKQIDSWLLVLNELDAVLKGDKLLPHWRMQQGKGINFTKLVENPPIFDLVLFVQGSAFVPYIEEGVVSNAARWRDLIAPFGSNFFNFSFWIN